MAAAAYKRWTGLVADLGLSFGVTSCRCGDGAEPLDTVAAAHPEGTVNLEPKPDPSDASRAKDSGVGAVDRADGATAVAPSQSVPSSEPSDAGRFEADGALVIASDLDASESNASDSGATDSFECGASGMATSDGGYFAGELCTVEASSFSGEGCSVVHASTFTCDSSLVGTRVSSNALLIPLGGGDTPAVDYLYRLGLQAQPEWVASSDRRCARWVLVDGADGPVVVEAAKKAGLSLLSWTSSVPNLPLPVELDVLYDAVLEDQTLHLVGNRGGQLIHVAADLGTSPLEVATETVAQGLVGGVFVAGRSPPAIEYHFEDDDFTTRVYDTVSKVSVAFTLWGTSTAWERVWAGNPDASDVGLDVLGQLSELQRPRCDHQTTCERETVEQTPNAHLGGRYLASNREFWFAEIVGDVTDTCVRDAQCAPVVGTALVERPVLHLKNLSAASEASIVFERLFDDYVGVDFANGRATDFVLSVSEYEFTSTRSGRVHHHVLQVDVDER